MSVHPSNPGNSPAGPEFTHRIDCRPDFSLLTVHVPAGETLKVEASAMAAMDRHMRLNTRLRGGLGRLLTGESIFINEFTVQDAPGEITIAPGPPGDIQHVRLTNNVLYLQNSAYLASTPGVQLETQWQGMIKGFFSGESLFLIRCRGAGELWFNSYGTMIELDVDGEQIVDTGYIAAFTSGLDYTVRPVGGLKATFFSGEGLVCHFRGRGRLWIQTRQVPRFSSWLYPFRPAPRRD